MLIRRQYAKIRITTSAQPVRIHLDNRRVRIDDGRLVTTGLCTVILIAIPKINFKMRPVPWLVIQLALFWAGVTFQAFAQVKTTAVKVIDVQESLFRDQIEALGTLRANESVALTVNATETITAIHFEDGARVNKNQLLVEMTSSEESALLAEAETNLREANQQLNRVRRLVEEGNASAALLDQLERNQQAADARLKAIQSRVKDRIVRAPFAGQVGLRNISLGALKQPGDIITTLTDDSQMKLDFTVPEVFLPALSANLPVVAVSRAYPNKAFEGLVVSIDNQVDPVTRAIIVRALLSNDEKLLKQGMLMQINLYMNERRGLRLPESALLPEGRQHFVMVATDKDDKLIAEKRLVEIASRRQGEVEIRTGLQLGERVITDGAFKVRPGSLISIAGSDIP